MKCRTMKYIKLWEDGFSNQQRLWELGMLERPPLVFKEDFSSRPTWVLKLGPAAWERVQHLFDEHGRPASPEVRGLRSMNGFSWDLYAIHYQQGGETIHKIYGVSGDWTFGNGPIYYPTRHAGNKTAAHEILGAFVKHWLNN